MIQIIALLKTRPLHSHPLKYIYHTGPSCCIELNVITLHSSGSIENSILQYTVHDVEEWLYSISLVLVLK